MSWECENCGELNDDVVHQSCWKCKRSKLGDGELEYGAGLEKPILCSTTREIPGRHIKEAKAVVFGEAILGANVFRDFLAGIRDIVGGRSGAYESKLKEGRNLAMNDMLLEAQRLKVDAVVGIDVDYETVGQSMLMICVSGTAVTLE